MFLHIFIKYPLSNEPNLKERPWTQLCMSIIFDTKCLRYYFNPDYAVGVDAEVQD